MAASPTVPTPSGAAPGTRISTRQAIPPPTTAPHALTATTFVSRRGRCGSRWAAKTLVASAAPTLARHEMTSALTVMNATAPRCSGASPRASTSTETK